VLAKVAAFEVRFQLRSPLFWISSAIFFRRGFGPWALGPMAIDRPSGYRVSARRHPMNASFPRAVLALVLFAASTTLAAEPAAKVEVMTPEAVAARRKAIVTENLTLTADQAKAFWPLYEGYQAERAGAADQRVALFGRFFEASAHVDAAGAKALLDDYQALARRDVEVRARWLDRMLAVLPAPIVLRYAQIENKMDVSIQYWVAEQLPLVIDGKRMSMGVGKRQ